jgi:hypothetical protein
MRATVCSRDWVEWLGQAGATSPVGESRSAVGAGESTARQALVLRVGGCEACHRGPGFLAAGCATVCTWLGVGNAYGLLPQLCLHQPSWLLTLLVRHAASMRVRCASIACMLLSLCPQVLSVVGRGFLVASCTRIASLAVLA